MSGTNRRPSRSLFARSIACLSVFLTVSVSWWPLVAAARASALAPTVKVPSSPAPFSIASARASVVDRVTPVAAVWRRQGQRQGGDRSAAVLFDGDQATSLRSEQDAVVVASLAQAQPIRGLGVFGQADGKLSVYLPDGAGMPGKPVAGLQDLDLASLPLRWNRFWSREAPVARDSRAGLAAPQSLGHLERSSSSGCYRTAPRSPRRRSPIGSWRGRRRGRWSSGPRRGRRTCRRPRSALTAWPRSRSAWPPIRGWSTGRSWSMS